MKHRPYPMRRIPLLVAAVPLFAGCVDATGILNDCSVEMAQARAANGGNLPDHATPVEEDRGDYIVEWEYFDSRRRYIFRWGVSYDGCQVSRTALNLLPDPRSIPPR